MIDTSVYSSDKEEFLQCFNVFLQGKNIGEPFTNALALQDYQGALEDFTYAIQVRPNLYVPYSSRASIKFHLKDYAGALEDYNTAIKLCIIGVNLCFI